MRADDLIGLRVGVCQSGGLSALAVAIWLRERGISARHYICDLGQSPPEELMALARSLAQQDIEAVVVDLRPAMADLAAELLRYRARHDGGYWNTASGSRLVLVRELASRMIADGCQVLAHGCVGTGNDQRRFQRYTMLLAPSLRVYAPWTDPAALARFPDRAAMEASVIEYGLRLDAGSSVDRSTDANLAGASHESAELEDLRTPVSVLRPRWSTWPASAPAIPQSLRVRFEQGAVADFAGSGPRPLSWLAAAHDVGARNGVWLRDVVEGRIIGTRCRGVYEAPALEVLDRAWRRVLETCLDIDSYQLYALLSARLGAAVYEARYLNQASVAARAGLDALLDEASATVSIEVCRGAVTVIGIEVPGGVRGQQARFPNGGHRWQQPDTAGHHEPLADFMVSS